VRAIQRDLMRHLLLAILLAGCATVEADPTLESTSDEITSSGAWYHLDAASGLGPATVTVANGYTVKCPNGQTSHTCHVSALVMPADCGWECQDGVLSLRGETLLRGRFDRGAFVVTTAMDTYTHGLGTYSVYELTAAPSCASDPCPHALTAKKLNIASAPVAVTSVDFSHADDPNYVLDPTRGDDQASSSAHLLVSGHIVSHVFRADRVWRLENTRTGCDAQQTARAYAYSGSEVIQFRTVAVAERAQAPAGEEGLSWLVRTGESPTTVTFTSGRNDLWAQQFDIAKSTCAVTVTHEH
jgi:hypothetical protein